MPFEIIIDQEGIGKEDEKNVFLKGKSYRQRNEEEIRNTEKG